MPSPQNPGTSLKCLMLISLPSTTCKAYIRSSRSDVSAVHLQAQKVLLQIQSGRPHTGRRVQLVAVPEDAVVYRCQHCGMQFNNLHQVKTHEGCAHSIHAPRQEFDATQRDSYSLHGLPQCRFCLQKFTRWRNLQRRISRSGCPALRTNDKSLSSCPKEMAPGQADCEPSDQPVALASQQKWKAIEDMTTAGQLSLCKCPSVQEAATKHGWQAVLRLSGGERACQATLYSVQAVGSTNEWRAAPLQMVTSCAEAKLWSKAAVSPCSVCGTAVKDARQHAGQRINCHATGNHAGAIHASARR